MGILNRFFKRSDIEQKFIGDWFSDLNDEITRNTMGDIKMSFGSNKELVYEIREMDKSQIIYMTYVIKGNKIITDQPAHPKIEESEFYFTDSNKLTIKFEDIETHFVKEAK